MCIRDRFNDGGRHHTEYQYHRNREAALHIAVVHLPCARDAGEDKGQKAVLFHGLFPLGGAAADALEKVTIHGEEYISVEELQQASGVGSSILDRLRQVGALGDLPESSQVSFF